jgi:hypothetical protein
MVTSLDMIVRLFKSPKRFSSLQLKFPLFHEVTCTHKPIATLSQLHGYGRRCFDDIT